jgi:hypothetical protein
MGCAALRAMRRPDRLSNASSECAGVRMEAGKGRPDNHLRPARLIRSLQLNGLFHPIHSFRRPTFLTLSPAIGYVARLDFLSLTDATEDLIEGAPCLANIANASAIIMPVFTAKTFFSALA